jgi:hypothetical protein
MRFFCCFILFACPGFITISGTDLIPWKAERKLSWDDFKGKHSTTGQLDAFTFTEMSYSPKFNQANDSLLLEVPCNFNCLKSTVRGSKKNGSLLSHEQLHFDIAELQARLFRKKLCEGKYTMKNAQSLMDAAFQEAMAKLKAMQVLYDTETEHSMKEDKQAEWSKKIASQLSELDTFGKTIVRVKITK